MQNGRLPRLSANAGASYDLPMPRHNDFDEPNSSGAPDASPWYAAGLQFTCTQCGRCCGGPPGYIWVSDEEILALAAELKLDEPTFRSRHTRRAGRRTSLHELKNGDCEFLRREPGGKAYCGVYGARPLQCRTWPFWASNLDSQKDWKLAGVTCPGMNHGTHHPLPVIRAALERNQAAGLPL